MAGRLARHGVFLSKMSSESSGLLLFYHDQTCSLLKTRNIGKTNLNGVVL